LILVEAGWWYVTTETGMVRTATAITPEVLSNHTPTTARARAAPAMVTIPATVTVIEEVGMGLHAFLLLASALFAIGLYGVLSQQSIVMLMMGLELMINGLIVAGGAFWYHVAPADADGQVLVLVAVTVMALEMAMGFAVVTAIFRARDVDMTDDAADLKG
jgi:NAD(P)H-quinone oxidoreductase subunit 4L